MRPATSPHLPKPGKGDYYNNKSYRTIYLSPLLLSKRQYGYTKGASTETALHKLVQKNEGAILNSVMP